MTDEAAMMDRIANQFVDVRPQDTASEDAQGAAPEVGEGEALPQDDGLAELLWGDKAYKVPRELKDAFMRNDDYTRKTQELAEQRRGVDQIKALAQERMSAAAFADSIQAEQQEIAVIDAYLTQAGKMNWAGMNTEQMMRAKLELDTVKERRMLLQQAVDGKRTSFQEQLRTKMDELRSKSREMASKAIPNFSEETEKAMRSFARAEGLSDPEIDNVLLDPRSYKVVWKAMQFDKVQAGTGRAVAAATKAAVLKPGGTSERMPPEVRNRLEFGKAMKSAKTSGQKAQVIEQRLTGMFGR